MSDNTFQDICDVRYRYAAGIDLRDWRLYRSIFADEVEVSMMTTVTAPVPEPRTMTGDDWTARVASLLGGFAATQHCMFNPRAEIVADTATLTTYMQAEHFLDFEDPDGWYTIGGYYTDHLALGDDGWKIDRLRLTLLWQRGNPGVLDEARRRVAAAAQLRDEGGR